jgi:hypothetical protein
LLPGTVWPTTVIRALVVIPSAGGPYADSRASVTVMAADAGAESPRESVAPISRALTTIRTIKVSHEARSDAQWPVEPEAMCRES